MEMLGQLSLFDGGLPGRTTAVNLFDHGKFQTKGIAAWMMRLVPKGEFLIMVGKYPCVLQRTKIRPEEVSKGLEFCHYLVDGAVYSGVFVGSENDDGEGEGNE